MSPTPEQMKRALASIEPQLKEGNYGAFVDIAPAYREGDNGSGIHLTVSPLGQMHVDGSPRHRATRPSPLFRTAFRATEAVGAAYEFVVGMGERMGRTRALLTLTLGIVLGVAITASAVFGSAR